MCNEHSTTILQPWLLRLHDGSSHDWAFIVFWLVVRAWGYKIMSHPEPKITKPPPHSSHELTSAASKPITPPKFDGFLHHLRLLFHRLLRRRQGRQHASCRAWGRHDCHLRSYRWGEAKQRRELLLHRCLSCNCQHLSSKFIPQGCGE